MWMGLVAMNTCRRRLSAGSSASAARWISPGLQRASEQIVAPLIAEARGHLQGDKPDPGAAKGELAKADALLDIIEAALPLSTVKDRIWVANKHLEYMDTQEVLPDLVPIFASLDEVADYMPVGQAKAHLDKAKEAMGKDRKEQAQEELKQVGVSLVYLEADLPLGSTRSLVDQAKEEDRKSVV